MNNSEICLQISELFKSMSNTSYADFGTALDDWYKLYKVTKLKNSTTKNELSYIELIKKSSLSEFPIDKITGQDLQQFLSTFTRTNTRDKIYCLLNSFFRKMIATRKLTYNPCSAVEFRKHKRKHYRPLEYDEQIAIMASETDDFYDSIFWILCCTGMRIGEFCALDFNYDINYYDQEIYITKSINSSTKELTTPKSESANRTIPFNVSLLSRIKIVRDYVNKGRSVNYDAIREHFRRMYKRLNINGVTTHSFRHTFITLANAVNINAKQIQVIVGHSTVEMTLNVYTHILKKGSSPLLDYMRDYANQLKLA